MQMRRYERTTFGHRLLFAPMNPADRGRSQALVHQSGLSPSSQFSAGSIKLFARDYLNLAESFQASRPNSTPRPESLKPLNGRLG